jgi:hypothetical protein
MPDRSTALHSGGIILRDFSDILRPLLFTSSPLNRERPTDGFGDDLQQMRTEELIHIWRGELIGQTSISHFPSGIHTQLGNSLTEGAFYIPRVLKSPEEKPNSGRCF